MHDLPKLVSVHGGHSGQFCNHAADQLEPIVQEYIAQGFAWVGISEHIPPLDERYFAPDELGFDLAYFHDRFGEYIAHCRHLQQKYAAEIEILVAFESESYSGYDQFVPEFIERYEPDYFVGSIHHVDDHSFDFSAAHYAQAVAAAGSLEALYCRYFDQQFEMIQTLRPQVVAHFDYIRILDPDYSNQLKLPNVWSRIQRNLACIQELGLILDFNTRSLSRGAAEPYISQPILEEAIALGIPVVPGDDSHGIASVGKNTRRAIKILQAAEANTDWHKPTEVNRG